MLRNHFLRQCGKLLPAVSIHQQLGQWCPYLCSWISRTPVENRLPEAITWMGEEEADVLSSLRQLCCASAPSPISALGAAEPSRYRVGLTQDVCQRARHLLMSFCYLEELMQAWGVGIVPAVVSSVPRATCKRRAEVPWHLGQTPCEPCGLHEPCYCHRTVHSGSALRARPKWVPINRVSPKTLVH